MLESLSEFYRDGRPVLPGAADLGPGEGLVVAEALGSRGAPADSISPVAAGASPRVLVVDDSAYFRAKTVRWLRSLGMGDVMETADGEEALRLYSQRRPDLVLLDLVMDGKSGVEVLREIKAIDPKARIVVVSAVGQDLLMEECRRQGALGFLVKPVAPERLAAEIKEAVSR
jgi:two-component system chemotaxis response regulator CheY